jgi:hypothetical protein
MRRQLIFALAVLLSTPALRAADAERWQRSCSLEGTWYGGSDQVKYLLTILPGARSDYTLIWSGAYAPAGIGYAAVTIVTGSIIRVPGGGFEAFAIAMANRVNIGPTPEIVAVHANLRFADCNSLTFNFDFFGAYAWVSNKTPFLDPPDAIPGPTPFTETYKRMPTICAFCGK